MPKTTEVPFIKLLCVRAESRGIRELKRRFYAHGSPIEFIFVETELAPDASAVSPSPTHTHTHIQMSELMRKAAQGRFRENKVDEEEIRSQREMSLLSSPPPRRSVRRYQPEKDETPVYS